MLYYLFNQLVVQLVAYMDKLIHHSRILLLIRLLRQLALHYKQLAIQLFFPQQQEGITFYRHIRKVLPFHRPYILLFLPTLVIMHHYFIGPSLPLEQYRDIFQCLLTFQLQDCPVSHSIFIFISLNKSSKGNIKTLICFYYMLFYNLQ